MTYADYKRFGKSIIAGKIAIVHLNGNVFDNRPENVQYVKTSENIKK